MSRLFLGPILTWLGRLRNPQLFVVVAGLFVIDLFVPDLLPFMDELLLGTLTLWLGSRRRRRNTVGREGVTIEAEPIDKSR